jgi:manganese-dependent inorganic pyrophosphatase
MDVWDNRIIHKSNTQIDNIIDILSGNPVYISKSKLEFRGKLLVLSMKTETMGKYIESDDIVICGDREDAQSFALDNEISLMIVTGGGEISENIIKKAKEKDVSLITTPHETFTTSRLIIQSVPVSYVMTRKNIINFDLDDLVEDVKAKMSQTRYRSYPVVDLNNNVVGLISRYHLISSKKKKVILVDHNERRQSIDGLEDAKILEIIDHHRVADVFTGTPIYFRNEPVGSTATIVASMFFENGRRPSKKIAGILSAAIISDTLLFKSPTATKTDKIILKRLEKIADIEVDKFAMEMFKEGTSLVGKTPEELLEEDFKIFTINEETIGISQVYTMDPESLTEMKDDLLELMEKKRKEERYLNFILMLTDIFNESSEMIVVGEYKDIIGKALGESTGNGSFHGQGILSRKKQVIPSITTAIEQIEEFK